MSTKILVRFDDICPTMDWELWKRAESHLNKFNVKPLIGVIPDCQDPDLQICDARPDFWEWVRNKQEEGYAIAMHGVNHVFCSPHRGLLNYRFNSEFAGLPYEQQLEKIRNGKTILESHGIYTDIFFAPAHSYDENTVKALAACGFKFISDGKSCKSYIWHGVTFLPCRNPGSVRIKGDGYYTSIYHAHEWVRPDKASEFNLYNELLNNFSAEIVSFEDYKGQPTSSNVIMRVDEIIFVKYENYILPYLRKLKRWIKI